MRSCFASVINTHETSCPRSHLALLARVAEQTRPVVLVHVVLAAGGALRGLRVDARHALRTISRLLPNCVYDQQKFAVITIRIHRPSCTVLLFTSGKMVLTGCRSYMQCVLAAHEVVRLLRSASPAYFFRLRNVKIQNIVGNVDLRLGTLMINLERFHTDHSIFSTYQRNMFPGLIYRPDGSPVVLLIFSSGKIVITGGKSVCDVADGWQALWPVVQRYICDRA